MLFARVSDLSKLEYTAMVKILLGSIRASGLALDVMDPVVFHPIPHFVRGRHVFGVGGVTQVHGTRIPDHDEVLSSSYVVSQTWFPWSNSSSLHDVPVEQDSLYSKLFARLSLPGIDGQSFRAITLDYLSSAIDRS